MKLLSSFVGLLAASSSSSSKSSSSWTGKINMKPPNLVTWLIDGNNLACSRGVPNDRDTIIEELQKIASSPVDTTITSTKTICNVVLVFDGHEDESFFCSKGDDKYFQYIITDGYGQQKDRADDYIVEEVLPSLAPLEGRIHLVSADKELMKRVRSSGINRKGGSFIHPPKFWKMYLPTLLQRRKQE